MLSIRYFSRNRVYSASWSLDVAGGNELTSKYCAYVITNQGGRELAALIDGTGSKT